MRFSIIFLFLSFFVHTSIAQSGRNVAKLVETHRTNDSNFTAIDLFKNDLKSLDTRTDLKDVLSKGTLLKIDEQKIQEVMSKNETTVLLRLPSLELGNVELELVKVDIVGPDFKVTTSDGRISYGQKGLHYRGVMKGNENSLASISIFEDEITGFFANEDGNYVIGKMDGDNEDNEHILYLDRDLLVSSNASCDTPDSDIPYKAKDLERDANARSTTNCVRVYIEVNNDIYNDKGAGTQNYVEGLFAQSATLYADENIPIAISEVKIWTGSSPYGGSDSYTYLVQFQNQFSNTNQFNGDIAHLLSYGNVGGIAAGFTGICNPNRDNSMCYSAINSSYATVPTWTWTVSVFTHEMGHLFGSYHTHGCYWNGNNTAIDGCYTPEGSCAQPGYPSAGGSIMSYCHLVSGVGISFLVSFGPQPASVIYNNINNGSCLGNGCQVVEPTCDDGIQNGNETGIDCGGPDCDACPPCTDNILMLTVTLDDYPEETSWYIKNAEGTTILSGGPYSDYPGGSTVTTEICIPDGCYDFTMDDLYVDGMCCAYGEGSYTLTNDSQVLATGGDFGDFETTNICLNVVASCTDGIQNGDEEGVDCGGRDCPPCPIVYCDSQGGDDAYDYIAGVVFGAINNPSTASGGYTDFTALNTDLDLNSTTTITLTPGFQGTSYTEYWRVWIDYNQDGDFTDPNELAYDIGVASENVATGTITVPTDALTGATRMRVSMKYYDATDDSTLPEPCANFAYGEVEDYTVTILSTTSCTDGVQNGNETGIDCGGPDCPACPTCSDGIQNGDETGVDCGGTCIPCSSCNDGVQNGDETGVDCGGSVCPACPTCTDGVQNGDETGVDCGGSCTPCSTATCNAPSNITSTVLSGQCVKLSWTAEPDPVDKYKVRYRVVGGSWTEYNAKYTLSFINDLAMNTTYEYQVKTNCIPGQSSSGWSAINTFTTLTDNCDRPQTIAVSGVTTTTATVTWVPTPDDLKYKVGYKKSGDTGYTQILINAPASSYELMSLVAGSNYKATVKTKCAGGWTNWTPKEDFTTLSSFDSANARMQEENTFSIYPNPVNDLVNVMYQADTNNKINIKVFDIFGKVLMSKNVTTHAGHNSVQLDVSQLNSGSHYVRIQNGNQQMTQRFVKL